MTTEGRSPWVELNGLSDRQIEILGKELNDWLVAKADDLPKAEDDNARREAEEVAALGRLVSGVRRGEVDPSDLIAGELVARTIGETRHLDELKEEYDRELGEHEAWVALLEYFDPAEADGAEAGDDEERIGDPESPDEEEPEDEPAPKWVEIAGRLSDDQLAIVRNEVSGTLAGRTGDLRILSKQDDRERQFAEIAALARLAFGLDRGELNVSDRLAQEMVGRLVEGSRNLNDYEELRERYEAGLAEQDALLAFARFFSDGDSATSAGSGDD